MRLAGALTALARWRRPRACALRDRLLAAAFALGGRRAQRGDMAHEP